MHVRRRMFLGKRLHSGYGKTLLSLTTWVSLLTCVMRLGGATRFYTAVSRRPWLSIHTARERTVHHTAVSTWIPLSHTPVTRTYLKPRHNDFRGVG